MFLCTKEVMAIFSVTKMTVSTWVKQGKLTPINNDPRYFIFSKEDVDCLILLKRQSK